MEVIRKTFLIRFLCIISSRDRFRRQSQRTHSFTPRARPRALRARRRAHLRRRLDLLYRIIHLRFPALSGQIVVRHVQIQRATARDESIDLSNRQHRQSRASIRSTIIHPLDRHRHRHPRVPRVPRARRTALITARDANGFRDANPARARLASPRLAVARAHLRSSRRRPRSTVLERRRRLNRRASSRRTQHGRVAKITKNTPSSKAVRWTRDEARSRRQVTRRARIK